MALIAFSETGLGKPKKKFDIERKKRRWVGKASIPNMGVKLAGMLREGLVQERPCPSVD
jgi:hypothetical protein